MMNGKKLSAAVLAGAMALAACSGDAVDDVTSEIEEATDASVADEVEQNAMDLASEVESEMSSLATEIQNSESADELETAWNDLQGEVTAAIASMQTDGSIETEGIEQELDAFQSELEAAGDDIAPDVRNAWDSLRSKIEELMS
jgi:phenylalanyl-tRNA synthetase alpha subunit